MHNIIYSNTIAKLFQMDDKENSELSSGDALSYVRGTTDYID